MAGKIDVNTPLIDVGTHVLTIRPNKQVRYTIPVEVARSGEATAEEIKFIVWAGTDEPFQEARIGTAEQKHLACEIRCTGKIAGHQICYPVVIDIPNRGDCGPEGIEETRGWIRVRSYEAAVSIKKQTLAHLTRLPCPARRWS